MELSEAYSVLGLSSDASATERLNVFRSQRERLESRLASAPTAALKEKYRRAIEKLEEAYELIDLNEAGEDLPIIRPQLGVDSVGEPSESQPVAGSRDVKDAEGVGNSSGRESARVSKSGRGGGDFLSMVFIMLLILGVAGGAYWYVAVYKPANDRLSTVVAGQLSELEVALDALDRREQALERDLRNLEQRERDIQRDGSAEEQTFYGKWRTSQEGYLRWYGDFSAGHPSRASLKTAQQLQSTDLNGASKAAEKGLNEIEDANEVAAKESYQRVGVNLINWVLEPQRTDPESYMTRIRDAHPEWINDSLSMLTDSLSDLEKASPLPGDVDEGLRRIRLVQGTPNQKWESKVARVRELEQFLKRSVVPEPEWNQYENSISELKGLTGSSSAEPFTQKLSNLKATVGDLKAKLSGLENRQATSSDIEALSQLGEWVGDSDPDYLRWKARLMPFGKNITVQTAGIEMIWVNPGSFLMGSQGRRRNGMTMRLSIVLS